MNALRDSLAEALREGAQRIDACHEAAPAQAKETFAAVMSRVIAERNAWMRAERRPGHEATLRRLNALLSLMASIEFPLAGLHRERMHAVATEMRAIAETVPA